MSAKMKLPAARRLFASPEPVKGDFSPSQQQPQGMKMMHLGGAPGQPQPVKMEFPLGSGQGGSNGPPPQGGPPGGPMRLPVGHPHGRPGPYQGMAGRPQPQFMQQQMMGRPGMGPPPGAMGGPGPSPPMDRGSSGPVGHHPMERGNGGPAPPSSQQQQQAPQQQQLQPPSHMPPPEPKPMPQQQPPAPPPGINQPVIVMPGNNEGVLIEKTKLEDLAREVEPTIVLEEAVKDALLDYTEEFVDELVDRVCRLATHRGNQRLEARDVELVLDQVFCMPRLPRSSTFMANSAGSTNANEKNPGVVAHNQRLALIKKTLKKI